MLSFASHEGIYWCLFSLDLYLCTCRRVLYSKFADSINFSPLEPHTLFQFIHLFCPQLAYIYSGGFELIYPSSIIDNSPFFISLAHLSHHHILVSWSWWYTSIFDHRAYGAPSIVSTKSWLALKPLLYIFLCVCGLGYTNVETRGQPWVSFLRHCLSCFWDSLSLAWNMLIFLCWLSRSPTCLCLPRTGITSCYTWPTSPVLYYVLQWVKSNHRDQHETCQDEQKEPATTD